MLEKFTLVIYAPSLPPPRSLSFLIACLLVKQKSHAIRNIGFLCLLTYSSLWPLYLLWALSAPGTFYACNPFLCTWDDLISTFLMWMPFMFLSGLVRLLGSSPGTVFSPEESFQLFSTRQGMRPKVNSSCAEGWPSGASLLCVDAKFCQMLINSYWEIMWFFFILLLWGIILINKYWLILHSRIKSYLTMANDVFNMLLDSIC